jgi:hypothetical protein
MGSHPGDDEGSVFIAFADNGANFGRANIKADY